MSNLVRSVCTAAALTAVGMLVITNLGHAQSGQTKLSKCYDTVVAACNKKSDKAATACANNGFNQCDKQHKAQIEIPQTEINQLRAQSMRGLQQPSSLAR